MRCYGERNLHENTISFIYDGDFGESLFYIYLLESQEEKRVVERFLKPMVKNNFVFLFLPKIPAINEREVS